MCNSCNKKSADVYYMVSQVTVSTCTRHNLAYASLSVKYTVKRFLIQQYIYVNWTRTQLLRVLSNSSCIVAGSWYYLPLVIVLILIIACNFILLTLEGNLCFDGRCSFVQCSEMIVVFKHFQLKVQVQNFTLIYQKKFTEYSMYKNWSPNSCTSSTCASFVRKIYIFLILGMVLTINMTTENSQNIGTWIKKKLIISTNERNE